MDRSRIDAHSAAVAAVQAAAPSTWTATSAAGTPVKNWTVPISPWATHQHQQHTQPEHDGACGVHREQAEAETDQQREVGDEQRRMHVHQRRDLDLQPRHRLGDALVARVRSGTGHQSAAHQLCGEHHGRQYRQVAQRLWRDGRRNTAVGLADLDVQQHRQPHHRHRGQQVNGDRPPEQPGEHRDTADHGLHHGRGRHQPGIDQYFAATARPCDGQHRQGGCQHHQEGDHPIAELDGLVDDGDLGVRNRDEAAGKALRPGRAAEARRGDADDRARHGNAALGQDDQQGDDALYPQARHGQQIDQPQEESSDGHGLDRRAPQLQHVVAACQHVASGSSDFGSNARRSSISAVSAFTRD